MRARGDLRVGAPVLSRALNMNFDFPTDLKNLQEEARRFLTARCADDIPRKVMDQDLRYDRDLFKLLADQGWLGVNVPERFGGSELGPLADCLLAEEAGRRQLPVPFGASFYRAVECLRKYASEAQKLDYLPRAASGELIFAFAIAETAGPIRLDLISTTVDGGRISGRKLAVIDGDIATHAIVVATDKMGHGPTLYICDLREPGVTITPGSCLDPTRSVAEISFSNVPVEPLALATDMGFVQLVLDQSAIILSFELLGVAGAALEMAKSYALQRVAFGRLIGSFQAIKHKLVDVYTLNELARSNAYYGAWALQNNVTNELPIAACIARIASGEAAWLAAKENIQVHGGIGYTWESHCHIIFRRSSFLMLSLGGTHEWKSRLLTELDAQSRRSETSFSREIRHGL